MVYRLLLCVSVLLAGCSRGPDWYPAPPNADAHLLRDVSRYVEGGVWRWGRPLDKVLFSSARDHHYQKPAPESLLRAGQDNLVEIEPDKVWTSKEDGAKLTILLIRAGFVE